VDVAVIGLGLIGGSLLRALAAAGHRATGFDADPATRELAAAEGARAQAAGNTLAAEGAHAQAAESAPAAGGFRVSGTLPEAIDGADLVVLSVPLPALPGVLDSLAGFDGLVTDVTSVKGPVRDQAVRHSLRRFVGGHPMAGKETSGFASADPALFDGCAWVLCLEPHDTDLDDWLTLAALFTAMGARVVPITAAEHDRAVAEISHVPHLLASALSLVLVENPLAATLAAGSFRDGTRVAATRAELIAAMCGGNADAVRNVLHSVIGDLQVMLENLDTPDPVRSLTPGLRLAGEVRRAWPPRPGEAGETPAKIDDLLALGRAGGWVTAVAENRATVLALRPETDRNSS
jgi:prephenate dehydrogenase